MWPNQQETADLVTFTEEILKGKLYCLCSANLWWTLNIFGKLFRDVLKIPSNIYDGVFCKNSWQLLAVKYFPKRLHHLCLIGPKVNFQNCFSWKNSVSFLKQKNSTKYLRRTNNIFKKSVFDGVIIIICFCFFPTLKFYLLRNSQG